MNEWTKRYYNEAYLKRWHLGPPDKKIQENAASILKLLQIKQGNSLLDVGCGQGRYSLAFAKTGVNVTGYDTSDVLLSEAKRLARSMGLSVKWLLGDMRKIPFEKQFDAVTLMDAFGFFKEDSDNQKAVSQMAKTLRPGGHIVMVVVNGSRILNNFQRFALEEQKGLIIEIERELLPERKAMSENLHIKDRNVESTYERYQRLYNAEELSELVNNAGFAIRNIFSNFTGAQFDPNSSEKIVLVAEKDQNVTNEWLRGVSEKGE
ncbi:methyltransferase domain-containing protein [candidate division WOR-3 bacterium]|nr:methyltransferase domain-containing protein [candidate division WOR-3 bacterium]